MTSQTLYKDPSQPIDQRVLNLLSLMNPEEKLAQLSGFLIHWGNLPAKLRNGHLVNITDEFEQTLLSGIGSLEYLHGSLQPSESVGYSNAIQQYVLENSRLGIPVLIHDECCHGQIAQDSTVFPLPPGLAATWDPELVKRVFDAIGREERSRGGHQCFTPVLDLGRDARWGRQEETFGEDAFLVSRMGVASVRGLQGGQKWPDLKHVVATPKHFAGYGQAIDGLQHGIAGIPPHMLRDEILLPFRAAVEEAYAKGIMTAYSEIDYIPCTANKWLLTEMLRTAWGFEGIVVSDFGAVQQLLNRFGVAADEKDAARIALEAGCDMDLHSGEYYRLLKDGYTSDPAIAALVDRSVKRVLRVKFEIGLFDHPYVEEKNMRTIVHCKAFQDLAYEAGAKSLILLKNNNELLPLDKNDIGSIALIGPHSKYLQFGGVSPHNRGINVLDGLQDRYGTGIEVFWTRGCGLTDRDEPLEYFPPLDDSTTIRQVPLDLEKNEIDKAAAIAKKADVAILCLGESTEITGENFKAWRGGDRLCLELIGQQIELLKAVKATGTPVVVVLIHGRALAIGPVLEHADAVIDAWNPGEKRGLVIADTLFGKINPGGKCSVTIPESAGACPVYYSKLSRGKTKSYAFGQKGELIPFGFGLSYTQFSFSNVRLEKATIAVGESASVLVDITNTGKYDGDEVPQVYVYKQVASVARPTRLLRGFKRVHLKAGETQTVHIELTQQAFRYTNAAMEDVIEPGVYDIGVGRHCDELTFIEVIIQ